ncbi:MAG: hypothetical protein ACP5I2_07875 [Fervidicoccaceae archaeon]
MSSKNCSSCLFFSPHIYYRNMGFCAKKRELVVNLDEGRSCPYYEEEEYENALSALREKGWVYCLSCGETITEENELFQHMKLKGHAIAGNIFIDDSILEESYSAD